MDAGQDQRATGGNCMSKDSISDSVYLYSANSEQMSPQGTLHE